MIITNEPLLAIFRTPGQCELCGTYCKRREPHHAFSRGHGGGSRLDVPINLVALGSAFDCRCHALAQSYKIKRGQVLEVIARREGTTAEAIEEEIYRLRRSDKGHPVPVDARDDCTKKEPEF